MLANKGLITAPCGEPRVGVHFSSPFRMSAFSQPRIRSSTRPSLTLASTRAIRRSCGIEIADEVGVRHVGIAVLDQPIDFPQRGVASASRTEAVAPVTEPRLENRFDREPNRLLDDAILDRRNAQRPRLAIALRDIDPFD